MTKDIEDHLLLKVKKNGKNSASFFCNPIKLQGNATLSLKH